MYRFLPTKVADVPFTLDIPNTTAMPVIGDKNQIEHEFDDNSLDIIEISDDSLFELDLQWDYLSETDKNTLIDLWCNSTLKANGSRRTFYWQHPLQSVVYVVRMLSELKVAYVPNLLQSVQRIRIQVVGYMVS